MKAVQLLWLFVLATLVFQTSGRINTSLSNDLAAVKIDTLSIKLDSKLFLISTNDGKLELIDEMKDSLTTVRIKLTYNKAMGTVLEIKNPFSKVLTYKALLYNFKKEQYIETNVYPVREKMGSYEMWPYKLDHILLTDFKLSYGK